MCEHPRTKAHAWPGALAKHAVPERSGVPVGRVSPVQGQLQGLSQGLWFNRARTGESR
jgi:hypothetical protein